MPSARPPKIAPTTSPAAPTPPAPIATFFCHGHAPSAAPPSPPGGASCNAGTGTLTFAASPSTFTVVFHVTLPGALTSTTCSPGSIAIAVPSCAAPTSCPSRRTTRPFVARTASGTSMVSRDSFGYSASARAFAVSARGSGGVLRPNTDAASTNIDHAEATLPRCS